MNKRKKSNNMVMNVTKISNKMKKNLLSIKIYYRMRKCFIIINNKHLFYKKMTEKDLLMKN